MKCFLSLMACRLIVPAIICYLTSRILLEAWAAALSAKRWGNRHRVMTFSKIHRSLHNWTQINGTQWIHREQRDWEISRSSLEPFQGLPVYDSTHPLPCPFPLPLVIRDAWIPDSLKKDLRILPSTKARTSSSINLSLLKKQNKTKKLF